MEAGIGKLLPKMLNSLSAGPQENSVRDRHHRHHHHHLLWERIRWGSGASGARKATLPFQAAGERARGLETKVGHSSSDSARDPPTSASSASPTSNGYDTPSLIPKPGDLRPPLAHPAPLGPTQCLRGVYSRSPEEGKVTQVSGSEPPRSLRCAPQRRRPPEAGGEGTAPREPARGRGRPAHLTRLARWLACLPLSLRVPDSAAGTAARPPPPGRFRAAPSGLLPRHTPTNTARAAPPPAASTPPAVRSPPRWWRRPPVPGFTRPCPPRSWPQSCSGRCAPGATLGVCIVFS
ncbi:uncharacterized protein [Equus asinus]|uniref:uncharacterized protein n=1 Tax=Equus asinus TaxID=9793 RepID=UPI0038F76160